MTESTRRVCSTPECGRPADHQKTLCSGCRRKKRLYGDVSGGRRHAQPGAPMELVIASANGTATPDEDGHLIWPYGTSESYGTIVVDGHLKTVGAVVLELAGFPKPTGARYEVAHAPIICARPLCYLLAHIRWATGHEQFLDKVLDGTAVHGTAVKTSKLNPESVQAIRRAYARGGISQLALAAQYGVGEMAINRAIRRITWADVP